MRIINLLHRGPIDYMEVDALQRAVHAEVASLRAPDTLIAWESRDVYTAGRRTRDEDVPDPSIPVIPMDRGGSVTYHGPGQLVIYPIIKVQPPKDVVAFVRATEKALIGASATWGLQGQQIEGRSGLWVGGNKLCAIGIKFANDTTMHGIAFNVSTDLSKFYKVNPCGITDAGVTSLLNEGINASIFSVADTLTEFLTSHLAQFQLRKENS